MILGVDRCIGVFGMFRIRSCPFNRTPYSNPLQNQVSFPMVTKAVNVLYKMGLASN